MDSAKLNGEFYLPTHVAPDNFGVWNFSHEEI